MPPLQSADTSSTSGTAPRNFARGRRLSDRILGIIAALAGLIVLVTSMSGVSTASAETPAERCARETSAYNAAWATSWAAGNPGSSPAEAPPPPVPYVCVEPQDPTTTPTSPTSTAPGLPETTDTGTGPNVGAHAPTDIPAPGDTPVVAAAPTAQHEQRQEGLGINPSRGGGSNRASDTTMPSYRAQAPGRTAVATATPLPNADNTEPNFNLRNPSPNEGLEASPLGFCIFGHYDHGGCRGGSLTHWDTWKPILTDAAKQVAITIGLAIASFLVLVAIFGLSELLLIIAAMTGVDLAAIAIWALIRALLATLARSYGAWIAWEWIDKRLGNLWKWIRGSGGGAGGQSDPQPEPEPEEPEPEPEPQPEPEQQPQPEVQPEPQPTPEPAPEPPAPLPDPRPGDRESRESPTKGGGSGGHGSGVPPEVRV